MAALVCLCAEDSSNGLDGACSKQLTLTNQWTSNSQPSNVLMQELRKLCPKSAPKTLTADRLAGIISNIKAHFIGVPTATVLGKLDTGADCSGSANSGLCLKYTDVHLGSTNTVDDISWIAALNQIVSDIKSHEETVAEITNIGRQLTANTEKAGAFIANLEQYMQAQAAVDTTAPHKPAQAQESDQNAKNACAQHGSNQTCTANNCKWDGTEETKGKCKPKDGEGQKTQGTGDGATGEAATGTTNAEGKKCSEKTKQEETKANPNPAQTQKNDQNAKDACAHHRSNTSCTNEGCKWDGTEETKGKCKPKDGEGQKTQGTGEGAAETNAEGKKCSEKTKQEECKDDCKWEDSKCKDSSILVNKQFALSVVSGAFGGHAFLISPPLSKNFPPAKILLL
ncbi:Trypanosomal VSG domain/Trypanosome variant surface glycoprotein C-terminal domain containing protein, putative [Trypanosoma equiperdum]|uniref:Trypanosomal VSG domain/Trypanosome variant surface glycoprotein C-terminal domain containing protein, putative n=1 Tax=Trypanosoma equiperdum TaxID=5694 RepID=A0A1G4IAE8_TRYEQ|nr:Trypanosomal VSG domain/Trypanosome variant surface glycoprotein C-terminal domain containing protein, putative [Trypanosoma equiperdum]